MEVPFRCQFLERDAVSLIASRGTGVSTLKRKPAKSWNGGDGGSSTSDDDLYSVISEGENGSSKTKELAAAFVATTALSLSASSDYYVVSDEDLESYIAVVINSACGLSAVLSADELVNPDHAVEMLRMGRRLTEADIKKGKTEAGRNPVGPAIAPAASGIGEVNFKLSNPKISAQPGLPVVVNIPKTGARALSASRYPTSGNVNARVRSTYAGDAKYNVGAKILCARHKGADGVIRSVLDLVREREEVLQYLTKLGMNLDEIEALIANASSASRKDLTAVDRVDGTLMKVLYVPLGDGEYVQVTPAGTIARYTELNARIRERGWLIDSSITKLTAHPANAGLHINIDHGQVHRLHAGFPRISTQTRLGFALLNGRSPFDRIVESDTAQHLLRLVTIQMDRRTLDGEEMKGYSNADIRDAVHGILAGITRQCAETAAWSADLISGDGAVRPGNGNAGKAKSYLRVLAGQDVTDIPEQEIRRSFVSDALNRVNADLHRHGKSLGMEHDARQAIAVIRDDMTKALEAVARSIL